MTSKILSSKALRPLAMLYGVFITSSLLRHLCYGADYLEMGNTGARGGSVEQHVDQARKTGACSLKDHKLTHVR